MNVHGVGKQTPMTRLVSVQRGPQGGGGIPQPISRDYKALITCRWASPVHMGIVREADRASEQGPAWSYVRAKLSISMRAKLAIVSEEGDQADCCSTMA